MSDEEILFRLCESGDLKSVHEMMTEGGGKDVIDAFRIFTVDLDKAIRGKEAEADRIRQRKSTGELRRALSTGANGAAALSRQPKKAQSVPTVPDQMLALTPLGVALVCGAHERTKQSSRQTGETFFMDEAGDLVERRRFDHVGVVKCLLKHGADVNSHHGNGRLWRFANGAYIGPPVVMWPVWMGMEHAQ